MNINRTIGGILHKFGYEVRRAGRGALVDPYEDQVSLLDGRREVTTILDVGANIGQTAHRYRALFPRADVYSLEPFEGTFNTLAKAFRDDPKVKPRRVALAEASGTKTFHLNRNDVTNSLLPAAADSFDHVPASMTETLSTIEVPARTLDEFLDDEGIVDLPILKLDVQGAELIVLDGARRTLDAGRIDIVYTEVSFAELYSGGADFCAIRARMAEHRYVLYGLYGLNQGSSGLLAWGDALFISPSLREAMRRHPSSGAGGRP